MFLSEVPLSCSLEKVIYFSTQTLIEINQNSDLKYSQLFEKTSDENPFSPIHFTIYLHTEKNIIKISSYFVIRKEEGMKVFIFSATKPKTETKFYVKKRLKLMITI